MVQHKSFEDMSCPIARSLDKVGEWWSMLILRDAFKGVTRFEAFQEGLGIGSSTLSRRLAWLVEEGLLERRQYCEHPPRFDYVLTRAGRDFQPVLEALVAWGRKHARPGDRHACNVPTASGSKAAKRQPPSC